MNEQNSSTYKKKISKIKILASFISKAEITEKCWLWKHGKYSNGYGVFRSKSAHRTIYELVFGKIPKGMNVCHRCDVRNCVNPEHLWLGTQKQNVQDMLMKGRGAYNSGENNPRSVLNRDLVHQIRKMSISMSHRQIADKLSLAYTTVYYAASGRTWK